jgi:hypothetical protein
LDIGFEICDEDGRWGMGDMRRQLIWDTIRPFSKISHISYPISPIPDLISLIVYSETLYLKDKPVQKEL